MFSITGRKFPHNLPRNLILATWMMPWLFHFFLEVETNSDQYLFLGNRARHKWIKLESLPELESQPNSKDLIRARFDSSAITRIVTRARVGFRARVTYFELGCSGTNIDPLTWFFLLCLMFSGLRNFVVDCHI